MKSLLFLLMALSPFPGDESPLSKSNAEFAKHWAAARKLAMAVAEAMPPDNYEFKTDPGAMSFGGQLTHLAQANYAFCAGLKDSQPPALPPPAGKQSVAKYLADSFDYCTPVISTLTQQQLDATHSSPDGRLTGREILLAMYGHMAHHRAAAEVYLRVKGIQPPSYIF
ncbi:MAG TPA: DinB family protein [Bryobacteraceae bacterium]